MRSCVSLWSEEVTEENADKRNERYASPEILHSAPLRSEWHGGIV